MQAESRLLPEVLAEVAFAGRGEMRARCRAFDWTTTPLGPVDEWSTSLRATVRLVLAHPLPAVLLCGAELVQIYNDHFRAMMGTRHPAGLGRPLRECFPEAWKINEQICERVWRGEGVSRENTLFPLAHVGKIFTHAYGPVYDDDGSVNGVLITVLKPSASEARQRFLLALSDRLRGLTDPDAMQYEAARALGKYLAADRVGFAEADPDGEHVIVTRNYANDVSRIVGRCRFDEDGLPLHAAFAEARTIIRPDVANDASLTAGERQSHALHQIGASVSVPASRNGRGRGRVAAVMFVHHAAPREYTAEDVALIEAVTARTWEAVERARSEASLRESEVRYRTTVEQLVLERTAERDRLRLQLAEAEETERRRLSRELHDQLGQQLTAIALGTDDALRHANDERLPIDVHSPLISRLSELQSLAHDMQVRTRYVALELRPAELEVMGLEGALDVYVREWSARYGIPVEFAFINTGERCSSPVVESTLYRIAQEALTNVAKHADAAGVSVIVEQAVHELRLIVEDDGVGFDVPSMRERVQTERRLGLAGMEERAALVGGSITIESSPDRGGTTIFVRLPATSA